MTQISGVDGKIWMAIKSRLQSFSGCKVVMPEENYNPDAADKFVLVQFVGTEYGGVLPVSVLCGEPIAGFLNLSVAYPTDLGFDSHIGLTGELIDHFRSGVKMTYADVSVGVTRKPTMSGNVVRQDAWNRIDVRADWRAWG